MSPELEWLCKMCFCQTLRCRSGPKKHPCKGKPLDPICPTDDM